MITEFPREDGTHVVKIPPSFVDRVPILMVAGKKKKNKSFLRVESTQTPFHRSSSHLNAFSGLSEHGDMPISVYFHGHMVIHHSMFTLRIFIRESRMAMENQQIIRIFQAVNSHKHSYLPYWIVDFGYEYLDSLYLPL